MFLGHSERLERLGDGGEVLRGMASVRDDAVGEVGTSGPEVQAQGRRPRGMDQGQGRDAAKSRFQTVSSERTQGVEEEARGLRI